MSVEKAPISVGVFLLLKKLRTVRVSGKNGWNGYGLGRELFFWWRIIMSENLPEWFSYLKRGLCHRRGIGGLRNIIDTGFIRPNNGSFPDTYPQSKHSYARANNLISLFDFETPTEKQILQQMDNWYSFFVDHKPVVVALTLNRHILSSKLISNEKAVENTQGKYYPILE